jgi:hypothetical protein
LRVKTLSKYQAPLSTTEQTFLPFERLGETCHELWSPQLNEVYEEYLQLQRDLTPKAILNPESEDTSGNITVQMGGISFVIDTDFEDFENEIRRLINGNIRILDVSDFEIVVRNDKVEFRTITGKITLPKEVGISLLQRTIQ